MVGQDVGVDLKLGLEIEGADVDHLVEVDHAVGRVMNRRQRVQGTQLTLDTGDAFGVEEVGLVQQQDVGKSDLLLRLGALLQIRVDVHGVDEADEGIQADMLLHLVGNEEGGGDGCGIGETGRLDQDAVEFAALLQLPERLDDEIAAHGAAQAAVVELDDLLLAVVDDELAVDRSLAELVDDDGDPLARLVLQDVVEKACLARAEEAGHDGGRNALVGICTRRDRHQLLHIK